MPGEFRVGEWLVQPRLGRVSRNGTAVRVRAKVMDVLVCLSKHPGEVVSKDELLRAVWGTEIVSESALTSTITELRQALADPAGQPRVVETIPKRGYRLIAPVAVCATVPVTGGGDGGQERGTRGHPRWRRLALVGTSSIAVALLVGFAAVGPTRPAVRTPVVAVLPFDLGDTPSVDAHFSEGLHQEVILRLGMIAGLKVIERAAVLRYRGERQDVQTLSRELGVDYVLRGTVSTNATRIRFAPVLIDVQREADRWSEQYDVDRSAARLMAIQSSVALAVAEALRVKISSSERGRIAGRSTEHALAYQFFLRAAETSAHPDPLAASSRREAFLQQAVDLDPGFAAAIGALAFTYAERSYTLGQSGDYADRAIQHARRSLAIDPALAEGHRALGLAYLDKGRLGDAAAAFRRLSDLLPSDGFALLVLGWIDYLQGRVANAVERWTAARMLSPFNPVLHQDLASAERLLGNTADADRWSALAERLGARPQAGVRRLLRAGKLREAQAVARQLVAGNPRSVQALEAAAEASIRAADFEEARRFLEQLERVAPDDWNYWGLTYRTSYAHVLRRLGRAADAERLLERTLRDALQRVEGGDERPGVLREIAGIHAARGDRAAARAWFERAVTAGWRLEALLPTPLFETVQDDPGFRQTLARVRQDLARANADIELRGLRQTNGT